VFCTPPPPLAVCPYSLLLHPPLTFVGHRDARRGPFVVIDREPIVLKSFGTPENSKVSVEEDPKNISNIDNEIWVMDKILGNKDTIMFLSCHFAGSF
jgi:hypothetical protein